jgi:hypothetical protein
LILGPLGLRLSAPRSWHIYTSCILYWISNGNNFIYAYSIISCCLPGSRVSFKFAPIYPSAMLFVTECCKRLMTHDVRCPRLMTINTPIRSKANLPHDTAICCCLFHSR